MLIALLLVVAILAGGWNYALPNFGKILAAAVSRGWLHVFSFGIEERLKVADAWQRFGAGRDI
jgi:hypothetical protein